MKFKLGERYKWYSISVPYAEGVTKPLIFIGSGKDSVKLYPNHAKYRRKAEFVIMDGPTGWFEPDDGDIVFRKLTKLDKIL